MTKGVSNPVILTPHVPLTSPGFVAKYFNFF